MLTLGLLHHGPPDLLTGLLGLCAHDSWWGTHAAYLSLLLSTCSRVLHTKHKLKEEFIQNFKTATNHRALLSKGPVQLRQPLACDVSLLPGRLLLKCQEWLQGWEGG